MKGRRETAFFFSDQLRSGTERVATSFLDYAQPTRKGCVFRPVVSADALNDLRFPF
jgi:hypothetical protein